MDERIRWINKPKVSKIQACSEAAPYSTACVLLYCSVCSERAASPWFLIGLICIMPTTQEEKGQVCTCCFKCCLLLEHVKSDYVSPWPVTDCSINTLSEISRLVKTPQESKHVVSCKTAIIQDKFHKFCSCETVSPSEDKASPKNEKFTLLSAHQHAYRKSAKHFQRLKTKQCTAFS